MELNFKEDKFQNEKLPKLCRKLMFFAVFIFL